MSFSDPTDGPSVAAIVTPWTPDTALSNLAHGLGRDGYNARREPLPNGYRAHTGELVQVQVLSLPKAGLSAIVPVEVGRVFHITRLLSAFLPTEVVVGWRRMSGFYPTAKIFWAGRPQWKDGEDPDHEVDFNVPRSQPAELRFPSPARVPLVASELTPMLLPILKPLVSAWKSPPLVAGALIGAWLHRSSALS